MKGRFPTVFIEDCHRIGIKPPKTADRNAALSLELSSLESINTRRGRTEIKMLFNRTGPKSPKIIKKNAKKYSNRGGKKVVLPLIISELLKSGIPWFKIYLASLSCLYERSSE